MESARTPRAKRNPVFYWDCDRRTGQVTNTSDIVSDEYEVVFNPTRNWRIAFNAAKAVAVRGNSGTDMVNIVSMMIPLIGGPAGQLVVEDNGALFGNVVRQSVVVPMLQVTTQDGSPTNERSTRGASRSR